MEQGEVVVYKAAQDIGLRLDPLSTVKEYLTVRYEGFRQGPF